MVAKFQAAFLPHMLDIFLTNMFMISYIFSSANADDYESKNPTSDVGKGEKFRIAADALKVSFTKKGGEIF